ncbi:hypothetical protein GCM10010420_00100 [Streptomyces glaucosporus]|uniref:Acyl-CoA carboxylase subunit epsilon n=1 Tax=Streptomyces glaucosporus TaxID=284044 RepID=A0ABP5UJL1_9ACTN
MPDETRPTLLTVVRGAPDDLELAAVTAVLLALLRNDPADDPGGGPGPEGPAPRAGWRAGRPGYRSPRAWSHP